MTRYGATLLLSAFLLFIVQPLLGKFILPWFGGTPAVWNTCMLFFQLLLLAGYSYSHLLSTSIRPRRQVLIHIGLLAAALIALPIDPSARWKPAGEHEPVWRIVTLLTASVGLPFFVLSSSAPLIQRWFSRSYPGLSPYRLYALSNLGSLLAIVAYPVLIEPRMTLASQSRVWSAGYVVFMLLSAACAWKLLRGPRAAEARPELDGRAPRFGDWVLWLGLSACSSALLLATTNQLCQDVAVIPLLWVLPLGLYLLTYIVAFHDERVYTRPIFIAALVIALAQTSAVLFGGVFVDIRLQIASYSFTLLVCCMVCHGELVRMKPAPRYLTWFYWVIAAGGALGGAFVTLAVPHLFDGYWEYHLSLLATFVLALIVLFRDGTSRLQRGRPVWAWTFLYAVGVALAVGLVINIRGSVRGNVEMARGFFGVLRVLEEDKGEPLKHRFSLMHGRIEHGYQFVHPEKRYWPTSYFGPDSGIGMAIRFHPNRLRTDGPRNLRLGVVGLGTGTLATYGEQGDVIRFYEINPEVVRLSQKYFTYCRDTQAAVDVVVGDARISMEQERERGEAQQFDILAVDAFSSDAIPVHLLTRECFRNYRYHLKPDGILAIHISNRYFDLKPVIRGLAETDPEDGIVAVWISAPGSSVQETDSTDWALITSNRRFFDSAEVRAAIRPWPVAERPPEVWTDDYSNLFTLLKRESR